jgi:CheY-like chemotaxis protein
MIRKKETNVENRILVVDDEELWRDWLKETLEKENYPVERAGTSDEAEGKLGQAFKQGQPFHLVTVDIDMPGSSLSEKPGGESLLELLRNEYPGTKRVIVSGAQLTKEEIEGYFQYEVLGFFSKGKFKDKDEGPQAIENFRQTVHGLARKSRIEDPHSNPYTGLPSLKPTEDELKELTHHPEDNQWTLFDITVENVQSLEEVCGWQHSLDALKNTAQILNSAVEELGTQLDFIGHIGVSNFIVITRSSHVEKMKTKINSDFDETARAFYPQPKEDKNGKITVRLSTGDERTLPLMELKIRTVSGEKDGPFSDIREIIEYGRATK